MASIPIMLAGAGLVTLGVTPTPDDVTVISPLIQIGLGLTLFTVGIFVNGKE